MNVAAIQRALQSRGYDLGPGGADGDAGPATVAAVAAFQAASGLVADGIAGPLTQAALAAPIAPRRATPAEPAWLTLARADLGTVEGIGRSNNPIVVRYFADAGFAGIRDDAVAWCAASVGAWLRRAGRAPSGSLAARSYELWGVGLAKPVLGSIGVKRRGGSAWQGHVGIVVGANARQIFLIGGNQADRVSVAAFPRPDFTAFRWPADQPVATGFALPATIAGAKANPREA